MNEKPQNNDFINNKEINEKTKLFTKISIGIFLLFGICLFIIILIYKKQALEVIFSYHDVMKKKFYITLIIFYSIILLSGLIVFPSALLEIINGFIFSSVFEGKFIGLFFGFSSMLFIHSLSAFLTYKYSNCCFGKRIKEFLLESNKNKTKTFDIILSTQPFKILFLLRLSPLLPSSMFNFLIGAFEISSFKYFLSCFGSFPSVFFNTYIGFSTININSFDDNLTKNEFISILLAIFGVIILIVSLIFFARISKHNIKKIIEENESSELEEI